MSVELNFVQSGKAWKGEIAGSLCSQSYTPPKIIGDLSWNLFLRIIDGFRFFFGPMRSKLYWEVVFVLCLLLFMFFCFIGVAKCIPPSSYECWPNTSICENAFYLQFHFPPFFSFYVFFFFFHLPIPVQSLILFYGLSFIDLTGL